jgi:hypothetical protein
MKKMSTPEKPERPGTRCSLCGKKPPHPPHPLEMAAVFDLDLWLCPPCEDVLKRTVLDLVNGLRRIRGVTSLLNYPEVDWSGGK